MAFENESDIEAVAKAMIAGTLPKPQWTHEAHFASALWLLSARGEAAFAEMPDLIRRYNEAAGGRNTDTEGYHETITQASLRMANAALASANGAPLHSVLRSLMAGPCGKSDWIFAYWTTARLMSPEARRAWVAPDVQPFPV